MIADGGIEPGIDGGRVLGDRNAVDVEGTSAREGIGGDWRDIAKGMTPTQTGLGGDRSLDAQIQRSPWHVDPKW